MVPLALKPKHKPVQTPYAALRLANTGAGPPLRDFLRRDFKDEPVGWVHLAPPFNCAPNDNVFFQEKDGATAARQVC